ncbi:SusC/RagA family TonB-linked outer membrane protein [Myroides guanonis]|uniref:TonB-linked outer membrane protein, SusC/RagA family n=1 Tax=Myroides guanonis TaxID=1150112 RepID=A0A1I3SSV6_9FLAO|nr:SusC/RagA family TonB-linked outer membrane protein [Myroides guanonis]SFJ60507.1 TonB-linked outer membrane protein, SusC/RagA family [Myroides guanonis]
MKHLLLKVVSPSLLFLLWGLFLTLPSLAATHSFTPIQKTWKLRGVVRDVDGPLPGVIVTCSAGAVITDTNGNYVIDTQIGDVVFFSFVGYSTQQVFIKNQTILDIILKTDVTQLDQITVNTGYYTVKDRERTGNIAKVTAKDIEFQAITNPLQALQGRMAGVDISQNSGLAGGGFRVKIRGRNSLQNLSTTSANEPLYVIDGVPLLQTNGKISGLSLEVLRNSFSALSAINPNDIESIEVLKDADATAIYGSRGANGVVLITTKKGKEGKTQFSLNASTGFSKVGSFMKMMNTQEFNKLRDEAFANDGITTFPANAYDMNGAWDRNRYTDWQKELIGKTAIDKNISFGMRGGNEYTRFNFNLAHGENSTVFPSSKGYARNSALISVDHQSKDAKLKIQSSTSYSAQSNDLPAADFTTPALNLAPNAPALHNPDGSLNWQNGTFNNPLSQLNKTYNSNTRTLILNTQVSYSFFPNTFLKVNAGITTNSIKEMQLAPHTIYNPAYGYTSASSQSTLNDYSSDSYIIEPQFHWNQDWGLHEVNALVGASYQASTTDNFGAFGFGFSSNAFITNLAAATYQYILNGTNSEYKYASIFARLNYGYKERYFLNLTARRDGSSRFGPDKKYGNFGAVGAAWLFSEELLFKDHRWLSFGKLRGSYGTTGSDNIGDYAYLDTYSSGYQQIYDGISGLAPTKLFNPDYGWEKTDKLEAAVELGFLKNRINTSVSWYQNRSSNQLLDYSLPNTTGFSGINSNFPATIQNSGWEVTFNVSPIQSKDWNWSTNFNISFPKNELLDFPNIESSPYRNSLIVGESVNIVKLYHYEGMDPTTGLYKFKDYDNNNIINAADKKAFKSIETSFHGGFQNTISYKNLQLDFLFQFVKQTNYNFYQLISNPPGFLNGTPSIMTDRWTPENTQALFSKATTQYNQYSTQVATMRESDHAIGDASYIRLKNISISYNFVIPKMPNTNIRVYLQGQNLWSWTNDYFGMDPEFNFDNSQQLPSLCSYALGLQLNF